MEVTVAGTDSRSDAGLDLGMIVWLAIGHGVDDYAVDCPIVRAVPVAPGVDLSAISMRGEPKWPSMLR